MRHLLGWPAEQVLDRFRAMDFDLETDAGGDTVGAGVSLDAEGPYAMQLKGQRVTGWCVMDVLMFPVVFKEESSRVTGRCATTGTPISLTVTPDGVRDLTPRPPASRWPRPPAPTSAKCFAIA